MPVAMLRTFGAIAAAFAVSLPCVHAQSAPAPAPLTRAQIFSQLDPQMAEVVLLYNAIKGTPVTSLSPQDARQQLSPQDAAKILSRGLGKAEAPLQVGKVIDGLTIDGPDANKIPVRIYVPEGSGPFPVTVYFHGGGFVIATIDTYDASARALCAYANSIVVSVEYRKSPEAPYPAARRDAITAYGWVTRNIGAYNGIASKVAVAGESAGGNLATEVAIDARDRNLQRPTHQLLIYPVTSGNINQPSDILYTDPVLPLTTSGLQYFYKFYLSDPSQADNPEVSPVNNNVTNLPPATIIAAELDPLVSDGQAYAMKLAKVGNPVAYQLYSGTTHEFFGMGDVVDKAKEAEMFAASRLAQSFQ